MASSNTVGVWSRCCPVCWGLGEDHIITKIEIGQYKKLSSVTVDCKKVNIFLGVPGSGKTAILETLALWMIFVSHQELAIGDVAAIKDWRELEGTKITYYDTYASAKLEISRDGKHLITYYKGEPVALLRSGDRSLKKWWVGSCEIEKPKIAYYRFGNPSFPVVIKDYVVPPYGANMDYILPLSKSLYGIAEEYGYKKGHFNELPEPVRRYLFYLAVVGFSDNMIIAIDDMTCGYPPFSKVVAESIARDERNQYFIATYDENILLPLIEKTPKKDLTIYVVKDDVKRADPEKILDLSCDVYFNLDIIAGGET